MNRRQVIKNTTCFGLGAIFSPLLCSAAAPDKKIDLIIGHQSHQYKIDVNWGALNANFYPVNDCHEMSLDSRGRILLLTNETKNNVLIYDKSGKILDAWGTEYPGAHGLTLQDEGGEDFCYITDTERHQVIKTTIDGKVVMTLDYPAESGFYTQKEQYVPTETAIASNGDIYVADGYGLQHILHYNAKGELLHIFGGKGENENQFLNAHGICLDDRDPKNPSLLISARQQNKLKRFSLDGQFQKNIDLPGAFICRPVIDGENVYMAVLVSKLPFNSQSGFVCILDKNDQVISNPGGSIPEYKNGQLSSMHQSIKIFQHPHDVCIDEDKNLYIAQWNSGKSYPIKLIRV